MKIVAFFIRHGETDMNNPPNGEPEKFRGDADIDLNEKGHKQAQALVPLFKAHKFSAAFSSGLKRTNQTLKPLLDDKEMSVQDLDDLDSLNTGDFTGLPKNDENKEKLEWYRQHPEVEIPGGESVQHFRDRTDPLLYRIINIGDSAGVPTVAAVHGSVMRELSRVLSPTWEQDKKSALSFGGSRSAKDAYDYAKTVFGKRTGGDYNKVKVDPGGVIGVYKTADGRYFAKPLLRESMTEEDIQPGS